MLRLVNEEVEVVGTFDDFWDLYPKKVAKKDAQLAWLKARVTPEIWARIVLSIAAHRVSEGWMDRGGMFIPHPATWLNGERWSDEIEVGIHTVLCFWKGCKRAGLHKLGPKEYCETHVQALKRGETP